MAEEGFRRKLAAILSADVEGYSRLMGDDEEATIRTLTTYRNAMTDLIQQYRGRLVDAPGDNLLAEFASVVDAVNCAVEIQRELAERNTDLPYNRKMEFRIGVNLGDVVEEEGRIYGDGVNIAARVESLAEAGGICISGRAYDQVENKLGLEYENLGEHQVKNIARPIRVYRVLSFPGAAAHRVVQAKEELGKRWRKSALVAVSVVVVATIAFVVWNSYFRLPSIESASVEKMAFPLPDKPSIAVLPFVNMSGDPKQEYIADGFTENIITGLSIIPELFVIARNSTFTYKGKPVKVQQVSEDLGVRYILEGSIQKSENRVRVTAQLIDAIKGHHLWAEKYDRDMMDFFGILDEITRKITVELQVELSAGVAARDIKCTGNFEAWKYITKARVVGGRLTKGSNAEARDLSERALKLAPESPCPLFYLGWTHLKDATFGWSKSRAISFKLAYKLAKKALAMDETWFGAHSMMGSIYLFQRKHNKSITEFEKAISLNPNLAGTYAFFGGALDYAGNPDEAIAMLKKAMRLHPYYPPWYLLFLIRAYRDAGHYEEAIAANEILLDRARKGEINQLFPHLYFTELYIEVGQEDKAKIHAAEVLKINPKYSLENFKKVASYKNPAHLERRLVALRKAGLPDKPPLPLPDKPSIAVLPFTNMSGDPEQEYFSDGLAENIITQLAKIPVMIVIARNSSFRYKGKSVNVQQVGKELNVRYILEGSVQKAGTQLRVTAQLIDAETGAHLWAQEYDRELQSFFKVQDEITLNVVNSLQVKLTEGAKDYVLRNRTTNLKAWAAYMKGYTLWQKLNKDDNARAMELFQQAIDLDPDYVTAYAGLAWGHLWESSSRWSNDPVRSLRLAEEFAKKSIAMGKTVSLGHGALAWIYGLQRKFDQALKEAELAMELAPNDSGMIITYARIKFWEGNPKEALELVKKAIRLSPLTQSGYQFFLGMGYLQTDQYEKATAVLTSALNRFPRFNLLRPYLIMAHVALGQKKEAQDVAEKLLEIDPKFSVKAWANKHFRRYKDPKHEVHIIEQLTKAGLK